MIFRKSIANAVASAVTGAIAILLVAAFTYVDAAAHGSGGFHGGFGSAMGHSFFGHGFYGNGFAFGHGLSNKRFYGHGYQHMAHHDGRHDNSRHGNMHGSGKWGGQGNGHGMLGPVGHRPGHWQFSSGFGGNHQQSQHFDGVWSR